MTKETFAPKKNCKKITQIGILIQPRFAGKKSCKFDFLGVCRTSNQSQKLIDIVLCIFFKDEYVLTKIFLYFFSQIGETRPQYVYHNGHQQQPFGPAHSGSMPRPQPRSQQHNNTL